MLYETRFILALIQTVVIETAVLIFLIRHIYRLDKNKLSKSLLLTTGFFVSFATLPYLWFILPAYISNVFAYVLVGELSVILLEAIIYYLLLKLSFKKTIIISFVCNLFSFLLGLLIIL